MATSSSGDVYVAGGTDGSFPGASNAGDSDAFLARYDKNGNLKWARQFGGSDYEFGRGVAASGSAVYVSGLEFGDIDGAGPETDHGLSDAFLTRFDKNGIQIWVRQFGTASPDNSQGVAVFGSNAIYPVGSTTGDIDGPGPGVLDATGDVYLARYDKEGNRAWIRPFGTTGSEEVQGVAVLTNGHPVVSGYTDGKLFGHAFAGEYDAFVVVFPPA